MTEFWEAIAEKVTLSKVLEDKLKFARQKK